MGLSFTTAVGPRQRIHSQVRLPRNSWPQFTVSPQMISQGQSQSHIATDGQSVCVDVKGK
jgi:hypothetical protein